MDSSHRVLGYGVSKVTACLCCVLSVYSRIVVLALSWHSFVLLQISFFPRGFATAEVLMRPAGVLLYEVDFTVLLSFVAYLLLCFFNGTQQEGKCQDEKMSRHRRCIRRWRHRASVHKTVATQRIGA